MHSRTNALTFRDYTIDHRLAGLDFRAKSPLGTDAVAVATISTRIISSGSIEGRPVWL